MADPIFPRSIIDTCMDEVKALLEAALPEAEKGPAVLVDEAADFVSQLEQTLAKLGAAIVITFESAMEGGLQAPGVVYFQEVVLGVYCFRNMALTRGKDLPTTRWMTEFVCAALKLARTESGTTLRLQRGEAQADQIRALPVEDNPSLSAIRVPIVARLAAFTQTPTPTP